MSRGGSWSFGTPYRRVVHRNFYTLDPMHSGKIRIGSLRRSALLAALQALDSGGEAALKRFHDEVCTATPRLIGALARNGLLRERRMDFAVLRARHFPGI